MLNAIADDPVAAFSVLTLARTPVVIVPVLIIAFLVTRVNDTIAAACRVAVVAAGVGVDVVAVVAMLVVIISFLKGSTLNPVTAARHLACIGARVLGVCVAIIAGFIAFNDAVAALMLQGTSCAASIVIDLVSIVANFVTCLTFVEIQPKDAIAAARHGAVVAASIGIGLIPIITSFSGIVHNAVTAAVYYDHRI